MESNSNVNIYKKFTIILAIVLVSVVSTWFFQNKNANQETERQYSLYRNHLYSIIIETDHLLDSLLEGNLNEEEEKRELIRLLQELQLIDKMTSWVPYYLDDIDPALGPSATPFRDSITFITAGVDSESLQFRPIEYSTPLNDQELAYLVEVKEYITYIREEMMESREQYYSENRDFSPAQFNQLMRSLSATYGTQYRDVFSVELDCEDTMTVNDDNTATVQGDCTMLEPFTWTAPPRELSLGKTLMIPFEKGDGQAYILKEEAFLDAGIIIRNLNPQESYRVVLYQNGSPIAYSDSEKNVYVRVGERVGDLEFRPTKDGTLYVSMMMSTSLVKSSSELEIKLLIEGQTVVASTVAVKVGGSY
ncbi:MULTISPECIES: hypothetical protein [Bacillaceae]|uniref:Uncharacterized protein n=1 Tax=Evansella alkalicola TaxID=745819 RepID=A0ABS6JXL8_9BACI|nr:MULTISPECIES: hypothetical protein [Bacillaceae]MBU9723328.1 hypothetical protein [Bacillus alkalicola]